MKSKLTIALVFLSAMTFSVLGAPEKPHRVFGEVTDETDEGVEVKGQFTYQGETLKQFKTGAEGFYDVKIPGGDYDGESISIKIENQEVSTIIFETLSVTEKNLKYVSEEEKEEEKKTPSQGSSGGGGGLGNLTDESNNTEKSENAEKANNSTKEDNDEELNKSIEDEETNQEKSKNNNQESENENKQDTSNKAVSKVGNVGSDGNVRVELESDYSEGGDDNSVNSIEFTSSSNDESVEVNVTEMNKEEFERSAGKDIGLPENGDAYKFIQIDTNEETNNASIEFNVKKSYLESRNASKDDVVQQRYNEGEWKRLETRMISEKEEEYVYEASSPEGFSNFAITIEENEESIRGNFTAENASSITLLILSIIAIISIIYYRRKGDRDSMIGLEDFT